MYFAFQLILSHWEGLTPPSDENQIPISSLKKILPQSDFFSDVPSVIEIFFCEITVSSLMRSWSNAHLVDWNFRKGVLRKHKARSTLTINQAIYLFLRLVIALWMFDRFKSNILEVMQRFAINQCTVHSFFPTVSCSTKNDWFFIKHWCRFGSINLSATFLPNTFRTFWTISKMWVAPATIWSTLRSFARALLPCLKHHNNSNNTTNNCFNTMKNSEYKSSQRMKVSFYKVTLLSWARTKLSSGWIYPGVWDLN